MTDPSALTITLLALTAFAAGTIDAVAGGGGLVTVPALLAAGLIAIVVGAYDGFFGPGTGTFLIVAFASILGDGLARASGEAKVVNFASNLAALVLFAARGVVVWRVALPMALAQLAGGTLGAHLTVRRGGGVVPRGGV